MQAAAHVETASVRSACSADVARAQAEAGYWHSHAQGVQAELQQMRDRHKGQEVLLNNAAHVAYERGKEAAQAAR